MSDHSVYYMEVEIVTHVVKGSAQLIVRPDRQLWINILYTYPWDMYNLIEKNRSCNQRSTNKQQSPVAILLFHTYTKPRLLKYSF